MDKFGEWLVDELVQRDLSQSDLSRLSGLSQGTISNIISGTRGRGTESLAAIAKALKLHVEDVYREAGLLPKPREQKDKWIRRIENKLEQITDEDDRRTIEGMIDLLAPDKKVRQRRRAKNEGTP